MGWKRISKKGLEGEQIPILSRIIAIVGAYDVMTSDESYRSLLTQEDAIDELRKNAGTQFDPELVERFIEAVASDESQVKKQDTR